MAMKNYTLCTALSLISLLLPLHVNSETLDEAVREKLKFFDIKPYLKLPLDSSDSARAKFTLGRRLFLDTNLSGNRNISCLSCHDPMKGLSDNLSLSQTEDGKGVLKRNSISLFNVGDPFNTNMFWDGRVQFNPQSKTFSTPEESLNGTKPMASEIAGVLTSALSAQTLFPLCS